VRRLHIATGTEERDEMQLALIASAEAALARIDALATEGRIDAAHADKLRAVYEHKRDIHRTPDDGHTLVHAAKHRDVERELIDAQREAIISLRESGAIDNVVLRRLEGDLDLEASRRALND
jgi:CPA1 family monovalent cation:H+ antiporter